MDNAAMRWLGDGWTRLARFAKGKPLGALGGVIVIALVLIALLAVLNAILAAFAALAVWKAYLAIGIKVAFIVLLCIPVVGIAIYFLWGRKKVEAAS